MSDYWWHQYMPAKPTLTMIGKIFYPKNKGEPLEIRIN
jgi:hypothetical protein